MIARNYQENAATVSHSALLKEWQSYIAWGYQPIPLKGFNAAEYQQAKQPTIKAWPTANPRKIDTNKLAGIGLVVGAKSRHIGLDCDSPQMEVESYSALQAMNIVDTWIVQSASGRQHFHFRIAPDVILPRQTKRARNEYDFFTSNGYLVAPPTQWQSYSWITIAGTPAKARILSQAQLNELSEFVEAYKRGKAAQAETFAQQQALIRPVGDLCAIFDSHVITMPRNPALFYTALYAYSNGYSAEDIEAELLGHFIQCPPSDKTQNLKRESSESRRNEGLETIQSACSGRYRASKPAAILPRTPANHLREHLLKQDETPALRLLEALYLNNAVTAGQALSRREIEQAVDGILTPRQCKTALESAIFTPATPKNSEHYNVHYEAARQGLTGGLNTESMNKTLVENELQKSHMGLGHTGKLLSMPQTNVCRVHEMSKIHSKAGRPVERLYTIPALASLYETFGLANKGSDVLPAEALKTDRAYRIALLKAFIERNPNRWPMNYLANLLGVKRRAVRYYIKDAGLTVVPQVDRQKVTRHNAMELVPENPADFGRLGYWLEDWNGNKHVPSLAHAERLLAYGEIHLCKQLPNYYTTNAESIPPYILSCQPKEPKKRGVSHE